MVALHKVSARHMLVYKHQLLLRDILDGQASVSKRPNVSASRPVLGNATEFV